VSNSGGYFIRVVVGTDPEDCNAATLGMGGGVATII